MKKQKLGGSRQEGKRGGWERCTPRPEPRLVRSLGGRRWVGAENLSRQLVALPLEETGFGGRTGSRLGLLR